MRVNTDVKIMNLLREYRVKSEMDKKSEDLANLKHDSIMIGSRNIEFEQRNIGIVFNPLSCAFTHFSMNECFLTTCCFFFLSSSRRTD